MTFFRIPQFVDELLNLKIDEPAHIIKSKNTLITKIIYTRASPIGKDISFSSKVEMIKNERERTSLIFGEKMTIVRAPQRLIPNHSKCERITRPADEGAFLIILE